MRINKQASWALGVIFITLLIVSLITLMLFWIPHYKVWKADKTWAAELAKAAQQKQIMIQQATAEKAAAVLRADAIKIIWEASQKYPEYRTQEFIWAFAEALIEWNIDQIIYVPTEANIPILEAWTR